MSERLGVEVLRKAYIHAIEALPFEACGFVHVSGCLHRCANVQSELNEADPRNAPRDARSAFTLSGLDLLYLEHSFASVDPVSIVYHSHPGGVGAYFSDEDRRRNVLDGSPLYPLDHLVIAVGREAEITEARLFRWTDTCGFVQAHAFAKTKG